MSGCKTNLSLVLMNAESEKALEQVSSANTKTHQIKMAHMPSVRYILRGHVTVNTARGTTSSFRFQ